MKKSKDEIAAVLKKGTPSNKAFEAFTETRFYSSGLYHDLLKDKRPAPDIIYNITAQLFGEGFKKGVEYANQQQSDDMAVKFKERIAFLESFIRDGGLSDECIHGYSDDKFCDSTDRCKMCLGK